MTNFLLIVNLYKILFQLIIIIININFITIKIINIDVRFCELFLLFYCC